MKRRRRNPANAVLTVWSRDRSYGLEKSLQLETAGATYWLDTYPLMEEAQASWSDAVSHYVEFTVELPGMRKGTGPYALGKFNAETGRFTWQTRGSNTARTLDEYGGILDLMMRWFFDQNMPPRGVDEATYDVEI